MDAYVYDAALLCDECGVEKIDELRAENVEDTGDSNDFPQGPYPNGGGEADTAQHCDACNVFLENDLTSDGYRAVAETIAENLAAKRLDSVSITQWAEYYDLDTVQKLVEALK